MDPKKICIVICSFILNSCDNDNSNPNKPSLEGCFTNNITGYNINCETVNQELCFTDSLFYFVKYCQDSNTLLDSISGITKRNSDLSYVLISPDSAKSYYVKIISDTSITLAINFKDKDQFVTDLIRKK